MNITQYREISRYRYRLTLINRYLQIFDPESIPLQIAYQAEYVVTPLKEVSIWEF